MNHTDLSTCLSTDLVSLGVGHNDDVETLFCGVILDRLVASCGLAHLAFAGTLDMGYGAGSGTLVVFKDSPCGPTRGH